MPKTRTEKIASFDEQITKLQEQRRKERQRQQQEERKAKERRYKKRHELLENSLPEVTSLTDEQYKTFLERAIANDIVRKIISNILSHGTKPVNEKQENALTHEENSTS